MSENSELKPRVEKLEDMYNQTSKAIIEMEVDFKHLSRSVEKIEQTMKIAVELMAKQDANLSAIKSAHHRIDELKVKVDELTITEARGEWLTNLGGKAVQITLGMILAGLMALVITKN